MSTQLVITALILACTVLIPVLIGLVALSTPMFVPETPETGSVEDMAPVSLDMSKPFPLGTVLPLADMLSMYIADLKTEVELVSTPTLTLLATIQAYMGLHTNTKTDFILSVSR